MKMILLRCVVGLPGSSPKTTDISTGDAVVVHLDPDLFMQAQQDHGGWNDKMAEVRASYLCPTYRGFYRRKVY